MTRPINTKPDASRMTENHVPSHNLPSHNERLSRQPDRTCTESKVGHAGPSIGFVSTYPPTACGIATFTSALRSAIADHRQSADRLSVVDLVETSRQKPASEVVFQHIIGDRRSLEAASQTLNEMDVAVMEHEFGIYGGPDGEEVLELISMLDIPSVVVLHTVPRHPTPNQQRILESLVRISDEVIVLSQSALSQLLTRYDVDRHNVKVVPHGAIAAREPRFRTAERPTVLTWGLIGPGKGLKTSLDAIAGLKDLQPLPRYIILGDIHPKVRAASGETYLTGLKNRAHELGLDDVVEFDTRYVDLTTLNATIRDADIVLIPYDSTEQVTSGVLVEAIAAGKPVVATDFPHAVEMLGTGAGIVVAHADPNAMSVALREILTDPATMASMGRVAMSIGATLDWATVALEYEDIVARLVRAHKRVMDATSSRYRYLPQVQVGLVRAG